MSQRKVRVHSLEFKTSLVRRVLAGESVLVLAKEFAIRRKLLYEWKARYKQFGEAGLRSVGRPRIIDPGLASASGPGSGPDSDSARSHLRAARKRISELERKVGQQEVELDFFGEALRRIRAVKDAEKPSAPLSPSEPRKAN